MDRLPMGLSIAPELLHTVCATLCAAPSFASPQLVVPRVRVDVFVDNGRWSGAPRDVRRAVAAADARVAAAGAEWKGADSADSAQGYTFLGVEYDHAARVVHVGAKTAAKISAAAAERHLRLDALESLAGRLCWAAAVVGVHLAPFFFLLKWLRRRLNALARGVVPGSTMITMPQGVHRRLRELVALCLSRREVRSLPKEAGDNYTLLTDASRTGLGVIVLRDGALFRCWGRSWSVAEQDLHINILEARAVCVGLNILPTEVRDCRLAVFVDNTSVVGAARRGSSSAAALSREVAAILREVQRRRLLATFDYVPTGVNPADLPSRDVTVREGGVVELAVAAFRDWRFGGGGDGRPAQ